MPQYSSLVLDCLVSAFCALPGIGQRSARRFAYYLLVKNPQAASELVGALQQALVALRPCQSCNTLSEHELCGICSAASRDPTTLCVVESSADLIQIEQTQAFNGYYFVLMGHISPMNGMGPDDLHFAQLKKRVFNGVVTEVIVATNFTHEGEMTAYCIAEMLRADGVRVTRMARGMPAGSELEYVDMVTIAHSLADRHCIRD